MRGDEPARAVGSPGADFGRGKVLKAADDEAAGEPRPCRGRRGRQGSGGTAAVTITDDLPPLELQMAWKQDNASAGLAIFTGTARGVARQHGWRQQ